MLGPFDVGFLNAMIRLTAPLLLAASGELIAQRSGVINIGLEGMMLIGAFFAFYGTWLFGNVWLGVCLGVLAGLVLALLMSFLTVEMYADQVIIGVSLIVLAFGVTSFAFDNVFGRLPQITVERMAPFAVPGLSRLPGVGRALFQQVPLVYVAYLLIPVVWFLLYRTSWGLALRASGETPDAAQAAGISVKRVRWLGTLAAGALAGLGGALLSSQLGFFLEGMSAGRGFLALAAVIFGKWRPLGTLGACLVFGAADALQLRLQASEFVPRQVWLAIAIVGSLYLISRVGSRRVFRPRSLGLAITASLVFVGMLLFILAPRMSFPSQLWLAVPPVLALVALAGFVGRAHMPSALAVPFRPRGE